MKTAANMHSSASQNQGSGMFFAKSAALAKPSPFFNKTEGIQKQEESGNQDSSNEIVATELPKVFTKPKSFWVMENDNGKNRSRAIYAAEPVTMEQLTHAIYKNPMPMLNSFSSHNGKTADEEVPAYTRIRIPKVNTEATGWAINGFSSSLIFKGAARNPFPILGAMGVSSTAEFAHKKKVIEQELKIEKLLMSMNVRIGMEDNFIKMLKKYADRNFTEYPDRYSGGGQYVDKIFLYLRSDFKKIGSFDQITSSYDLIFNHFKRANEVRQIREFHSAMFAGDDGIREVTYSAVFLEEAFEKALTVAGVPKTEIMSFLNKAGGAIAEIISKPKKFLGNLIGAVKLGFSQFVGALPSYLGPGLLDWVLGKIGAQSVEIPKDFSVKSILKLALQSLKLTPENLKDMVVEIVGSENVAKVEKVWGVIRTFMKGGIAGLANQLVNYVGDLKTTLVDKLKNWILKDLVKSAVSELLQMFIPGGGLVKVVKKIYGIIQFVRSKLSDLKELFTTVGQSVLQIVKGDISTAAMKINQALKKGLYLLIDLLARLMKVNFLDGIKKAIQNLRSKIVDGIKQLVEKIVVGGKDTIGNVKTKLSEWWNLKKGFKTKNGHEHELYFVNQNDEAELYMASTPKTVTSFLSGLNIANTDKEKIQAKRNAIEVAKKLNKVKYKKPGANLSSEAKSEFYRNKTRQIKIHLTELSISATVLLGEEGAPLGTISDPIPIKWYKKPSDYPQTITLRDGLGYDKMFSFKGGLKPFILDESLVSGRTKGSIMKDLQGLVSSTHQEGEVKAYLEIGVENYNHVNENDVLKKTKSARKMFKGKYQRALRKVFGRHGYPMGGKDADHVKDLQFGGQDDVNNLWPLDSGINQSSFQFANQAVTYKKKDGTIVLTTLGDKRLKNKYFKVQSYHSF